MTIFSNNGIAINLNTGNYFEDEVLDELEKGKEYTMREVVRFFADKRNISIITNNIDYLNGDSVDTVRVLDIFEDAIEYSNDSSKTCEFRRRNIYIIDKL